MGYFTLPIILLFVSKAMEKTELKEILELLELTSDEENDHDSDSEIENQKNITNEDFQNEILKLFVPGTQLIEVIKNENQNICETFICILFQNPYQKILENFLKQIPLGFVSILELAPQIILIRCKNKKLNPNITIENSKVFRKAALQRLLEIEEFLDTIDYPVNNNFLKWQLVYEKTNSIEELIECIENHLQHCIQKSFFKSIIAECIVCETPEFLFQENNSINFKHIPLLAYFFDFEELYKMIFPRLVAFMDNVTNKNHDVSGIYKLTDQFIHNHPVYRRKTNKRLSIHLFYDGFRWIFSSDFKKKIVWSDLKNYLYPNEQQRWNRGKLWVARKHEKNKHVHENMKYNVAAYETLKLTSIAKIYNSVHDKTFETFIKQCHFNTLQDILNQQNVSSLQAFLDKKSF